METLFIRFAVQHGDILLQHGQVRNCGLLKEFSEECEEMGLLSHMMTCEYSGEYIEAEDAYRLLGVSLWKLLQGGSQSAIDVLADIDTSAPSTNKELKKWFNKTFLLSDDELIAFKLEGLN